MIHKKIIFTILLLSFFTANLIAQEIKSFNDLIGVWEGGYNKGGYTNNEMMTNKWVLNDKYFQMDLSGWEANNPEKIYSSISLLTFVDDNNIVGWYFSDEGYKNIVTYTGKIENGQIILKGKGSHIIEKQTFEIKEGKLINKREYIYKDEDVIVIEVVFTKKM